MNARLHIEFVLCLQSLFWRTSVRQCSSVQSQDSKVCPIWTRFLVVWNNIRPPSEDLRWPEIGVEVLVSIAPDGYHTVQVSINVVFLYNEGIGCGKCGCSGPSCLEQEDCMGRMHAYQDFVRNSPGIPLVFPWDFPGIFPRMSTWAIIWSVCSIQPCLFEVKKLIFVLNLTVIKLFFQVVRTAKNSLNNRFLPYDAIQTESHSVAGRWRSSAARRDHVWVQVWTRFSKATFRFINFFYKNNNSPEWG